MKIYAGYDPREAIGFHVFVSSLIHNSGDVEIVPLKGDWQKDGTNQFIYSRFLVPEKQGYKGWALFADGSDMLCLDDINKLESYQHDRYACLVVKHDYETRFSRKYVGSSMEATNANYPRKNWSSLILWNCAHPKNRILTSDFVREMPGVFLHRFSWLRDDEIGELPATWNHLAMEYPETEGKSLVHYTLGIPAFPAYSGTDYSSAWWQEHKRVNRIG